MSVQISVRELGGVCVLDVRGRITLGERSILFRDKVKELVNQGKKNILLNMTRVAYADSSGIGELVCAYTLVANHGGQFKVLGFQKRIDDLLHLTKLYTVFEVYNDEDAAIKSFQD